MPKIDSENIVLLATHLRAEHEKTLERMCIALTVAAGGRIHVRRDHLRDVALCDFEKEQRADGSIIFTARRRTEND